jgi:hypothetical protein
MLQVCISPFYISANYSERCGSKTSLKYPENTGLAKYSLTVGQKAVLLQKCHIERELLRQAA